MYKISQTNSHGNFIQLYCSIYFPYASIDYGDTVRLKHFPVGYASFNTLKQYINFINFTSFHQNDKSRCLMPRFQSMIISTATKISILEKLRKFVLYGIC